MVKEKELNLDEFAINRISESLTNLNLNFIRKLSKRNLMEIILLRETRLNNLVNEFQDGLKQNDKLVFIKLKKENTDLKNDLLKIDFYKELTEANKQINILESKLRIARNKMRWQND